MKARSLPSLEYLNECFMLDPTCPSGLRWKKRPREHFPTDRGWAVANGKVGNKPAGTFSTNKKGKQYFAVELLNSNYLTHRIIYFMFHKVELLNNMEIDHIDDNGLNNSIENLRLATSGENQRNVKRQSNNTSGIKGVHYHKGNGCWIGRVGHNGKRYHTGYSPSKEIVAEMLLELREKLHRDFTNHG